MEELARKNRGEVLDVLTERLTYERAGVKLYDKVIECVRASSEPAITKMLGQLAEHRDQEKEHQEWLEGQIRALGGDPNASTKMSRTIETESKGVEQVILGGQASMRQMFHALATAELVDNAGWDLLVDLADEADDDDAKKAFKKRLHEEEEHLVFAKRALEKLTVHDVLGESVSLPTSP